MSTRGYVYNQTCVHIHIIMGSQILVYYTRDTCLATCPLSVTDFTHEYPWT